MEKIEQNPDGKSRQEWHGERGSKRLKSTEESNRYMKAYFKEAKEKSAQGEPVVWNIMYTPKEIFNAMGIMNLDMLHYSALISAKQLSSYYMDKLNVQGYFRDLCRYCALPLGYAMDKKEEIAPWGGLPKLTALVLHVADDPIVKIWEIYSREFNVPLYVIDQPYPTRIPTAGNMWEEGGVLDGGFEWEPYAVDFFVDALQGLIRFLETVTGKHFSDSNLRTTLKMANETNERYWKITDMAVTAKPCPVAGTDAWANVPAFVFFPGTEWAAEHSKNYYQEVSQKIENGEGCCRNQRLKLMFHGPPFWFSLGFYNTWEESHGAFFIPTGYFGMLDLARRFIMRDISEPVRALARRMAVFYFDRYVPTTSNQLHLLLARRYKFDGFIRVMPESCKFIASMAPWDDEAMQVARIPFLRINADMVDARDWDDAKMKSLVTSFIETILP